MRRCGRASTRWSTASRLRRWSRAAAREPRRQHALATLRHRDFALLWGGTFVSTVGDQMQAVAIAWHIYVLTGSALQLGLVGATRAIPFLLLTLIGGALA